MSLLKNRSKKEPIYKNEVFILSLVIIGVFLVGSAASIQSSFVPVSGIWEADIRIKGIGIDGNYIKFEDIVNPTIYTYTKVGYNPDGSPNSESQLSSMDSYGLLPEYQWSIGSFFHVDAAGNPVADTKPKEDIVIDGTRYLTYYFGFSLSIITRSTHQDIDVAHIIDNFDYYGEQIKLYEYPEFASAEVLGDVGIVLKNIDNTVHTDIGVKSIIMLRYRTIYTAASGIGQPSDISDFNIAYDWLDVYEPGFIDEPKNTIEYYQLGADEYVASVKMETTMKPGSEYAIDRGIWNEPIGGTFNVFDVEIVVDYMATVVMTYELAADVGGYLEDRLDISGTEDPYKGDLLSLLAQFFSSLIENIMDIFGLSDPLMAIIILVLLVVVAVIIIKVIKKVLFPSRIVIGMQRY